MPEIFFPEFRDAYESTNYPFADNATLTNSTGQAILQGTLLGASLYPVGGQSNMYLSQVVVTFQTCTLTIGDSATKNLASGTFSLFDPPDVVALTDSYGRPAGVLVSTPDRWAFFQGFGAGTFNFTVAQTEFVAGVCFPTPGVGLEGVQLPDGTLLTGDVWLVGEDGVVLRLETVRVPGPCGGATVTQHVIRVDVVGDPLFLRRLYSPELGFPTPNFIKQIQFQKGSYSFLAMPDAVGNVTIGVSTQSTPDTVLRISATAAGVKFEMAGETVSQG